MHWIRREWRTSDIRSCLSSLLENRMEQVAQEGPSAAFGAALLTQRIMKTAAGGAYGGTRSVQIDACMGPPRVARNAAAYVSHMVNRNGMVYALEPSVATASNGARRML
jgi:hypothetical protein